MPCRKNRTEKKGRITYIMKILYVHGFASSGHSGTTQHLHQTLPEAEIVSPDLPEKPSEALELLQILCKKENPDLIIGSSMGGMYAEQLYGYPRILVNPAFEMADTLMKNLGLGRHAYLSPREDGVKDLLVTKSTIQEFRSVTDRSFSGAEAEDKRIVYGLFGKRDPLVNTYDLFASHYPNAVRFDGEHRLNDHAFHHSVLPLIHRLSDLTNGTERAKIVISIDCLRRRNDKEASGYELLPSALKAVETLYYTYDLYFLIPSPTYGTESLDEARAWIEEHIGVPAYDRLVYTTHAELLYADHLISREEHPNALGGQHVFGQPAMKTWDDVLEYFSHMGGQ